MTKNLVSPPPLIWTKSKRTAVFFSGERPLGVPCITCCLLVFPDMASTPRPTLCPPAPHSASPHHHLLHLDGPLPGRRDVHPLILQLHLYMYNFPGHPCLCLTNSAAPTTQAQVKKSSHQVFKV